MTRRMNIVVLGLSITSSWGNGHASTYRALLRAMARRGHSITFLERDVPWYAKHRDLPEPPYCRTRLYASLDDLPDRFEGQIAGADVVIVGSYVPDGIAVGEFVIAAAGGVRAFYDIDTPVTLESLANGTCDYLATALIPEYDIYLSFTGGPTLNLLEQQFGSPFARALHCSVDEALYQPAKAEARWDLGYLGTYSRDRQPMLEELLLQPARRWPEGRFVVAGPQYPDDIHWPKNVQRIDHLPPDEHPPFYYSQRFTLNLTRADMRAAGYSPSVRLFEAAACGTPIISDDWVGLGDTFTIGSEILTAETADDVLAILRNTLQPKRDAIAAAARRRVMREHTARQRAEQLEACLNEVRTAHRSARPSPQLREVADG